MTELTAPQARLADLAIGIAAEMPRRPGRCLEHRHHAARRRGKAAVEGRLIIRAKHRLLRLVTPLGLQLLLRGHLGTTFEHAQIYTIVSPSLPPGVPTPSWRVLTSPWRVLTSP